MKISRLSINDLLKYDTEEYVKENILNTFSSRKNNNVEDFLHNKAIFFEKSSISTTHLIFDNNDTLLGYFSVANKSLILPNERFENLSNSKQKKLIQSGQKVGNGFYLVNSYLLGQLDKNYSEEINENNQISGMQLLTLAYDTLMEAKKIINVRYVWLECEDTEKLLNFYKTFGFEEIENFTSVNNLKVLIMKLKK